MRAIFKREFKSYFTSLMGYLVVAFFICIVGLYFTIYNLTQQYPWFGVGLSNTAFILMIIIPVITMKIMAEERKSKTDQLLCTAPVRIIDIVLGKYFAVLCVFAIPMIVFLFYPLILMGFGKSAASLPMDYVTILGFFLLGAAQIAIGFYISTITESQVLAAVFSFAVLLLCYYSSAISTLIPSDAEASLIGLGVLIIILAVLIFAMTKNWVLSLVSAAVLLGILVLLFFKNPEFLAGTVNKVISVLDLNSRMSKFVLGELQISSVVYYLSFTGLFLFLSVQAVNKRRWS